MIEKNKKELFDKIFILLEMLKEKEVYLSQVPNHIQHIEDLLKELEKYED